MGHLSQDEEMQLGKDVATAVFERIRAEGVTIGPKVAGPNEGIEHLVGYHVALDPGEVQAGVDVDEVVGVAARQLLGSLEGRPSRVTKGGLTSQVWTDDNGWMHFFGRIYLDPAGEMARWRDILSALVH
jgi:hypothetical protein